MNIGRARIAIDIGSQNVRVYTDKNGLILTEPSVVAYSKKTGRVSAIGFEALQKSRAQDKTHNPTAAYKRGVIAHVNTAENIIKYCLSKSTRAMFLVQPEVMFTISSNATSAEKRALLDAAKKSGVTNTHLIPATVAAALGAAIPVMEPRGYMIIDIGSQTTELAIISLGGVVYQKSIRFGGDDINSHIIQQIKRQYGVTIGHDTAESLKCEHGRLGLVKSKKRVAVDGYNKSDSSAGSTEISVQELSEIIKKPVTKITQLAKYAFEHISADLVADIAKTGVTLTGGGAQLKGLPVFFNAQVGVPSHCAPKADTCAVKGAHIALSHLDDFKKSQLK